MLNEVVIDRGPSPYLSNIDLFLDGKHITSVQGDGESLVMSLSTTSADFSLFFALGLIVSTPTGSTAYAVAAGASMIRKFFSFIKLPVPLRCYLNIKRILLLVLEFWKVYKA